MEERINTWLRDRGLEELLPYEVLWTNREVVVIRLRTGLIEVIPLNADLIMSYSGCASTGHWLEFWVFDLGGEDWMILLLKDGKLHVYTLDNWELILKGLEHYEPFEVINIKK